MFKKQCMKFGSTALLLFAAVIAGGCSTTTLYRANPEDTRDLSPVQARNLLIKEAQAALCSFYSYEKRVVTVNHKEIRIICADSLQGSYRFAEDPELQAKLENDPMGPVSLPSVRAVIYASGDRRKQMFFWGGADSHSQARNLIRAWYVWARDAPALYRAQEAAFEQAAQSYRNASVKPQLPEEAVKYKVQAELAVQQKRFDDAADLYDQALDIVPWWPAGHYNRGLILGELQDYEEAVVEFKHYLKVEPDASNARAVQLKIYQWESLVPRAAK